MNKALFLIPVVAIVALAGCGGFTLKPVDFAWPIESVLTTDANGVIEDHANHLWLNMKPLFFEETGDSVNVADKEIRLIRDGEGYYYITALKYKNVHVFATIQGGLKRENKILVSEKGLTAPALNARPPYIQVLNGKEKAQLVSRNGIEQPQGGKK
jgi:hypothetical protein